MPRRDSDRIAQAIQVDVWRLLTPGATLTPEKREIARESILASHPSYTRDEVEQALQRLIHGARAVGASSDATS